MVHFSLQELFEAAGFVVERLSIKVGFCLN